jgi:hypothetical protein
MAEDFETTAPVGLTPAPVGMTRSGVRVNPDGSISRGLGPEPTAQTTAPVPAPAPTTVPGPSLQLNIEPVVFDKPEIDAFTRMFQTASGGPSGVIAREVAGQVAIGNEEFFSYDSLRDGTARLFDLDPVTRDRSPRDRALTDNQIINLLAVDTEGNPIEAGTFGAGAAREALPQVGAFGGFIAGARATSALPIPHPLVKAGVGLIGGIVGAIAGYEGGEALTDELLGPERPLLPGQTAAYEQGKTGMGVLAWAPTPFMVSRNVSLGTAQYLQNLAAQGVADTPRSVRLAQGIENMLGRMGTSAREAPVGTILLEGFIGAGQVAGAGMAETEAPGQVGTRITAELLGGVGAQVIGNPVTTMATQLGNIGEILRNVKTQYDAGGITAVLSPLQRGRQTQAVNRILEILEAEGEDVNAVIERLASNDLSNLLVDEAGRPIPLTAGAKAGSPALLAIEASLDQLGSALGRDRTAGSEAAIKALRNVILAMAQTGDQAALQQAADLAEGVFSAQLNNNLATATDNVLAAYRQVSGANGGPETNIRLSETLYDVVLNQMRLARDRERSLWMNVPNITAATPEDAAAEVPAFIREWNTLTSGTDEVAAEIRAALPRINQFVTRKTRELGLDAAADGDGATDAADLGTLTTRELTDIRSMALNLGRQFEANGDRNNARVAYSMSDALLDDLQNARGEGDDWRIAYDMARAYSRSLNDTFTRAFAGNALATQRTGAERIAPELLASRLLQGGNDPTYLRTLQINEIGAFAAREGLEGADQTIGTLRGTTEQILRNARAASFNPETGQVNPDALARWVEQNKDLLDAFPALRTDLLNAQKANLLLNETGVANRRTQAETMAQLSFYDLMNPVISPDGRRIYGTESPTSAIARALSSGNKTPIRSLNRLLEVVTDAPPDLQPQAMTGLKSSILEWAATKAGGSMSGTFSPSTLYDSMFKPLPGSQNRISLVDWMRENDVIGEMEVSNLRTYLNEMVKFEASQSAGSMDELVERAGPILDFYLSITGSAIGTRAQSLITGGTSGPGSLIAAGRGAETMRKLFSEIPAALQTDVMSELMRNPELLAAMMRRPRNERESLRLVERMRNLLVDGGFVAPARRALPGIVRETSRDRFEPPAVPAAPAMPAPDAPPTVPVAPPPNIPPPNQRGSLTPPRAPAPTGGGGAAATAPIQSAAAPQAPPPPPSGPVDRARFAAFFPNDSTTDLIRQQAASSGIGSLMGG